jgi:predicted kinase
MSGNAMEEAQKELEKGNVLIEPAFSDIKMEFQNSLKLCDIDTQTKQFLLCSVGLIGAGKTTTMKHISEYVPFVRVRTDDIRTLLKSKGYNCIETRNIAIAIIKDLLTLGYNAGLDADCVGRKNREAIEQLPIHFPDVLFIWIHIFADDTIIKARLSADNPLRDYKGPDVIRLYEARKVLHENITIDFDATIDTSAENTDEQFETLVKTIKNKISS